MNYWQLSRSYPRYLLYGGIHTMFSGFGQTYLIALFVIQICEKFALSRTEFSSMYALASVCSAALLPFTGRIIDRINLRFFSTGVAITLGLSLIAMGLARNELMVMGALIGLRQAGQALMSHTSATSIARYFTSVRGKALGLANIGFPLSEAILPLAVAQALVLFHWESLFLAMGGVCFLIFIPITWSLVSKDDPFSLPQPPMGKNTSEDESKQFTVKDVLKTKYFYLMLPAAIMAPFILTGLIFHQDVIANLKGWSIQWVASCFVAFAIFRVLGSFGTGPIVDRFTAKKTFPFHLIPMTLGILVLHHESGPAAALICWGFAGLTTGMGSNVKQAIWAEVYGTKHLGAIRSLFGPIAVLSTAASPPLFAWFFDQGWSFYDVFNFCYVSVAVSTLLASMATFSKWNLGLK